jgi:transcriptional regulator with XRE-family HTH domain
MAVQKTVKRVPGRIRGLPLGQRIKWARTSAGFSHDRLVKELGRSNRGHLIKIEKGDHRPRIDLRNAIADATGVPRDLFAEEDDEESDSAVHLAAKGLVSTLLAEVRRQAEVERGGVA